MDSCGPQAAEADLSIPLPVFTSLDPPETNAHSPFTHPPTGGKQDQRNIDHDMRLDNPGVAFRHSGWKKDRQRVREAFYRTHQPLNRQVDFLECGKHVYVYQSVDDPSQYSVGGSTCHDRFCLPCGRERSRRIATNVLHKIEKEQARFLTLTLKSATEPLAELLAKLTANFTTLRGTKLWRNKVTGGVAFLEIKWFANTQRWHPHLHCLVQGRYLPRDELSKLWLKITGTSHIVDIRFAKDNNLVTHYITKYATKPLDHTVVIDPDRLCEAILALKGKRLCLTFGSWRGFSLTAPTQDGQWINLGLLSELVKAATAGNPSATKALIALDVSYPPKARDPPSLPAVSSSPIANDQLSFPRFPTPRFEMD